MVASNLLSMSGAGSHRRESTEPPMSPSSDPSDPQAAAHAARDAWLHWDDGRSLLAAKPLAGGGSQRGARLLDHCHFISAASDGSA